MYKRARFPASRAGWAGRSSAVGLLVRRHALHPKRQSLLQSVSESDGRRGAAPGVTAAPIGQPAPVAAAGQSPPAPAAQPVVGSAVGWTAVGGSPIVVAAGRDAGYALDPLRRSYRRAAQGQRTFERLAGQGRHAHRRSRLSRGRPRRRERSAAQAGEEARGRRRRRWVVEGGQGEGEGQGCRQSGEARRKGGADPHPRMPRARVAYAEPSKPSQIKKPAIDSAPTGKVESGGETKVPLTGAQADASGVEPEFRWPARGRIIQGFKSGGNDGINISVPAGTSVRAAENGVVVYAGDGLKGYGNLVLIKHPNGFVTAYGNNAELEVKRGETVKRGQVIAKSGDTGNVNSPQLHFELRKGSTPVDPTNYLAGL